MQESPMLSPFVGRRDATPVLKHITIKQANATERNIQLPGGILMRGTPILSSFAKN